MKKPFLKLASFVFACISLPIAIHAQCVPDANLTTVGVYPAAVPDVCVGIPVNETIQFVVPASLSLGNLTFQADSVLILSITGLPAGLNYQCPTARCKTVINPVSGMANTCMLLSGSANTAGDYSPKINAVAYKSGIPTSYPFDLTLKVLSASDSKCTNGLTKAVELSSSVSPNPVLWTDDLNITLSKSGSTTIEVYSTMGIKVSEYTFTGKSGNNGIPVQSLVNGTENGVYTLRIKESDSTIFSSRIIIQ